MLHSLFGFNREDLAAAADGLEAGYEKYIDVGDGTAGIPSTTLYAARFIREALRAAAAPAPERWIVARETVVQIPGAAPRIGYTVFDDAEPFASFDAASAFIKAHALPLGWVAMRASQAPWDSLLGLAQIGDANAAPGAHGMPQAATLNPAGAETDHA